MTHLYKTIDKFNGYYIFYTSKKGIQVKYGEIVYKEYGDGRIGTDFASSDNKRYFYHNHYKMIPLEICENGRIIVLNKEDINEGISILKNYLRKRIVLESKQLENKISKYKKAIESEVRYGDL